MLEWAKQKSTGTLQVFADVWYKCSINLRSFPEHIQHLKTTL